MTPLFQRLFGRLSRFFGGCLSFLRTLSRGSFASLQPFSFLCVSRDDSDEPLSKQLDMLKSYSAAVREHSPLSDHFPPTLTSEDGPLVAYWVSGYSSHYFTRNVVIKREPHKDELGLDIYGNPCVFPYISDRIRIEAANLQFIAKNTTIPVPQFLGLWLEHGLWHIKTSLVDAGGALELMCLDDDKQPLAAAKVAEQIESEILPQLRRLRRRFMGCADPNLPVVPPHRFWEAKDKRVWSSMPQDDDDAYVFCHTDLGRQNILVDPDTFRIVSIIDWETAGFWPASWELPIWTTATPQERHKLTSAHRPTELTMIEAWEPED